MFPAEKDPTGGTKAVVSGGAQRQDTDSRVLEPETWTESELRRWLRSVS